MRKMTIRSLSAMVAILGALGGNEQAAALPSAPPGYEVAVDRMPWQHWALVTSVTLIDRKAYGATYWDRRIEIPRVPDNRVLWHEVGHVVALAYPELETIHWRQFTHRSPDIHESFADGYRAHIEGRTRGTPEWEWWDGVVMRRDRPAVPIPPSATIDPPTVSVCTRTDVPAGSIVPGCTGR